MRVLSALLLSLFFAVPAGAMQNGLQGHASAYLAMHGDDPIAWQEWGPEVLALAQREDRLILISSGYFACHWCHVMQRESFRDPTIAHWINRHFIPVKLDRELNSALDGYLIDFVQRTQGQAGWPLTVLLTPQGNPLLGSTYLPPEQFLGLLKRLQAVWVDDRQHLRDLAQRAMMASRRTGTAAPPAALAPAELRARLVREALGMADLLAGGFGEQSRFPMAPQLRVLLDIQRRWPQPALAEFLTLTLDQMAGLGLRDQLGGGFFRYTVDPGWHVPHFEKMLYTQAMLAEIYLKAADILQRPDYLAVVRDTLDFALRDMQAPDGGFVASLSAVDAEGEEGGAYLWTRARLDTLLDEADATLASRYWGMHGEPTVGGGYLPRRGESVDELAADLARSPGAIAADLQTIRVRLLAARGEHGIPVDDKRLSGWNGLMLAALAQAAVRLQEPRYRVAATQLQGFLQRQLWRDGRLRRAFVDAPLPAHGELSDYAYLAYGLLHGHALADTPAENDWYRRLLAGAWGFFVAGGWQEGSEHLLPGMGSVAALGEDALPAPSAMLLQLSQNDPVYALDARTAEALAASRALTQAKPFWYAGHALALLHGVPGPGEE